MVEIFKNDTQETATNLGTLAFPQDLPTDVIATTNVWEFDDVYSVQSVTVGFGDGVTPSNDLHDYYRFTPYRLQSVRVEFTASSTGDYGTLLSVIPVQGVSKVEGDIASVWAGGVLKDTVYDATVLGLANSLEASAALAYPFQFVGDGVSKNDFPDSTAIWTLTGDEVIFDVNGFEVRGSLDAIENNPGAAFGDVNFRVEIYPHLGFPKSEGPDSSQAFETFTGSTTDLGDGFDSVAFAKAVTDYVIAVQAPGNVMIVDGKTIAGVERGVFADQTVALDVEQGEVAGSAYRIYKAAFDRTPDADGLEFWITSMDAGVALLDVAKGFLGSSEFQALYGTNPSNSMFVDKLYQNVLGREGEAAGVDFWNGVLDRQEIDMAEALMYFSESSENVLGVAPLIDNGIWY